MKTYDIEMRTLEEQPTAAMFATLTVEEIGPWIGRAYGTVAGSLARRGAGPTGMPYARYHRVSDSTFEVEAGFGAAQPVDPDGEVRPSSLPSGPAAVTLHVGSYDEMAPAYEALTAWVCAHGGRPAGDAWEVYYSDPVTVPDPADWRTEVVQPYLPA